MCPLGWETLTARCLMNDLSRRTREETCSALAGIVSLRKILCSPPGSHLVLSRQSLVNSSKTQRVVSIFSLNGRNKCFPKCRCMTFLHNWQSGNTRTLYKNQNTPLLGRAEGLKLMGPFSWFLLRVCQPHQNTSWAPARLTFMCKHQRKSL